MLKRQAKERETEPSVIEAIQERRSIRKFLDLPVHWENVSQILDAGRMAPSAGNVQDWKLIVIVEPKKRLEIAEACLQQYWMAMAPVHIVVCSQPKKSERYYGKRGEEMYSVLNAGACIENMLLAAHGLGLGACTVSAFEDSALRRTLAMPDNARPIAVVALGHPAEEPEAPVKFELDEILFFEKWGNRLKDKDTAEQEYGKNVAKALAKAKEWAENVLKKMREVEK